MPNEPSILPCSAVRRNSGSSSGATAAAGNSSPPHHPAQISLIVTSMLPRVALQYGQILSAASTSSFAELRSRPGSLTWSRVLRKWPPSPRFRSTSAPMPTLAGRAIFLSRAASAIACAKEADQPAANSCSGLVPMRAELGVESLMSSRPSALREAPLSRSPVVSVLAVME